MTWEDFVRRIVTALDHADVPYMVTGSLASSYHGVPRGTRDVDVVIAPTREQLEALVASFPQPRFYVGADAAREALERGGQFNVIDSSSGLKADFIFRRDRPFSLREFERRERVNLAGTPVWITNAEDAIVSKLEWARRSDSERQLEDVVAILNTQSGQLDLAYIEHWVAELALTAEWKRAQAQL